MTLGYGDVHMRVFLFFLSLSLFVGIEQLYTQLSSQQVKYASSPELCGVSLILWMGPGMIECSI